MRKLGNEARGTLFIQLANFPKHYLVLVVTDERFQYALITTKTIEDSMYASMVLEDIAWLDFSRIHDAGVVLSADNKAASPGTLKQVGGEEALDKEPYSGFNIDTQGLRELYSYCWYALLPYTTFAQLMRYFSARVAFMNVERQFKIRGIPVTHVNPSNLRPSSPEVAQVQSSLARSVPALCVQSEHILSGAPAAEAAMPNIRVIPLNWWSKEKAQVGPASSLCL